MNFISMSSENQMNTRKASKLLALFALGAALSTGVHAQQKAGNLTTLKTSQCANPDKDNIGRMKNEPDPDDPPQLIRGSTEQNRVEWDDVAKFGKVPDKLRMRGDNICSILGKNIRAIGYHQYAMDRTGNIIQGGGFYCGRVREDSECGNPKEDRITDLPNMEDPPRLIRKDGQLGWDDHSKFGRVPRNLQQKGDNICNVLGRVVIALGYHPEAQDEQGKPIDGGAYYCNSVAELEDGKISDKSTLAVTPLDETQKVAAVDSLVVKVANQWYEITAFNDSYAKRTARFQTPANGGMMPWWGNSQLAEEFAKAVGQRMGYPNREADGPLFAFNDKIQAQAHTRIISPKNRETRLRQVNGIRDYYEWTTYAVATKVAAPANTPAK